MPLGRPNQRRIVASSSSTLTMAALCALTSMASCSRQIDPTLSQEPPSVDGKKRGASMRDASTSDDALDGSAVDAETRITTREKEVDAGVAPDSESKPKATKKTTKKAEDAGVQKEAEEPKAEEKTSRDAGKPDDKKPEDKPSTAENKTEPPEQKVDDQCTRMRLREKADTYLQSLATGDTMPLALHPSFRYTENGRDEQLGAGVWLRRGESLFSRHVLDETSCSTVTQAVLDGLTGRFSFGVRLRYAEGQLLEAEAQVVPELLAATDLDTIIPMGDDAFIAEVPQDKRASRAELFDVGQRYFDSVTGVTMLPPSAPECRRLQNGLPLGNGTCTERPGTARFEQQRFDVADEPSGIITATVLYENHIGFYLLKIADHMLQDIQVIGGATTQATGW